MLLKSVIQAIPIFIMGCFNLLLGLCNDIEALIKNKNKNKKIIGATVENGEKFIG